MKIAVNRIGHRVYADEFDKIDPVFCPVCGQPVIFKSGQIRHCYFSHIPGAECKDAWHYEDMCEWHQEWQGQFSSNQQEIVFDHEGQRHRADVSFGNVVVEFQHSPISSGEFNDRNSFYFKLGKTVVWLFDGIDDYEKGRIRPWDRRPQEFLSWSFSPMALHDYFLGSEKPPFVLLQIHRSPDLILWIKPDISLVNRTRGFTVISKLAKSGFLALVDLLSGEKGHQSHNFFEENYVFSSADVFGEATKYGFFICHLAGDGLSNLAKCRSCCYRKGIGDTNVVCSIARMDGETIVSNSPRSLIDYLFDEIPSKMVFYSPEVKRVVYCVKLSKWDRQLYGDSWAKNEFGEYSFLGYGRLDYSQLAIWRPAPKTLFPQIDFSIV